MRACRADMCAPLARRWPPSRLGARTASLIRKERLMCRWLAYSGSPILLEKALYSPAHSLIDQSLHSTLGAEATNGDGFGIGWYDDPPTPGVFRSIEPAWNDVNLRELAAHVTLGPFLRSHPGGDRVGGPADELPPVPPRPLAVHAQRLHRRPPPSARPLAGRRRVALPEIAGHADTEILFDLALPSARGRAGGRRRPDHRPGRRRRSPKGVDFPFQGTIATTDG